MYVNLCVYGQGSEGCVSTSPLQAQGRSSSSPWWSPIQVLTGLDAT